MRISIIADCHLNKSNYKGVLDKKYTSLPFRTVDFMKAFNFMVNKNIKDIKPDLIVIAGDIYDTYDPSNEVRSFFHKQLKKITDANIPVIILVGNHDICKKHHALSPLKSLSLSNIEVIEEPTLKVFKDKLLMLFPYSMSVERQEVTIKQQFYTFLDECNLYNKEKKYTAKDIIFFGHFGVSGAVVKSTSLNSKEQQIINKDSEDISLSDLEKINAKHVFLGDYHEHQVLSLKDIFAMYTGSIEQTDISERNQQKGFIVYDDMYEIDSVMGQARFIQYPNCRPMVQCKGNLQEIEKQIKNLSFNSQPLIKIAFEGNHDELIDFSSNFDRLKEDLKRKFNPIHIYHEQNVVNDKDKDQESTINNFISEQDHINEKIVLQVIKEMILEKEKEEKEQNVLLEIAKNIYKEANTV